MTNPGRISNDLINKDEVDTLNKNFVDKLRLIGQRHTVTILNTQTAFKMNRDALNSSQKVQPKLTLMPVSESLIINDNNTYYEYFIDPSIIGVVGGSDSDSLPWIFPVVFSTPTSTTDWDFDYTTNTVTYGTTVLRSGIVVQDSNLYTKVKVTLLNPRQEFLDNITVTIETEDGVYTLDSYNETTFPITQWIRYRLTNNLGSLINVDMFDELGKVMIMKIEYF